MDNRLHALQTHIPEPPRFTYPFNYVPHPLCLLAASQVQEYLQQEASWQEEIGRGKMFGVLVVRITRAEIPAHNSKDDGTQPTLGFLAAYSGLLGGRNDWTYFVPPVFDSQQPDGYFKTHEREISLLNAEISRLESSPRLAETAARLEQTKSEHEAGIEVFKAEMQRAKHRRHQLRTASPPPSPQDLAAAIQESQFQKAELRRMKQRLAAAVMPLKQELNALQEDINRLKTMRKTMSDSLQQWLFQQYNILNARGQRQNLCEIFAQTPQRIPPSGAGDCCAPKLLQYAFLKGYHPVCMAEFWWGESPKAEIRHHLHYYPACRSKCRPILGFMLQGLNVDGDPHNATVGETGELRILYEDDSIIVVRKPSGMLSVPGLVDRPSVVDILRRGREDNAFLVPAHRLDMATSGLLVVAKTDAALRTLHRQFALREVHKRYVAVLDGVPCCPASGTIRLPLAPDLLDSPRQIVSPNGKQAETHYEIKSIVNGKTLVHLYPHTGRTHQLRVHCAHKQGLGIPIYDDALYGHPRGGRMLLHAEQISLNHPETGQRLHFSDPAPWTVESLNTLN